MIFLQHRKKYCAYLVPGSKFLTGESIGGERRGAPSSLSWAVSQSLYRMEIMPTPWLTVISTRSAALEYPGEV